MKKMCKKSEKSTKARPPFPSRPRPLVIVRCHGVVGVVSEVFGPWDGARRAHGLQIRHGGSPREGLPRLWSRPFPSGLPFGRAGPGRVEVEAPYEANPARRAFRSPGRTVRTSGTPHRT